MVARHERDHAAARADRRRDLLRTCGHILFWVICGLGLMGLGLHVSDPVLGRVYWTAGQVVWLSGVLFSLLAGYRRGERRGDW